MKCCWLIGKKMVGKMVSTFQNTFLEGRQILDVVLVSNETFDLMLRSNSYGILFKLDMTMLIEIFYLKL